MNREIAILNNTSLTQWQNSIIPLLQTISGQIYSSIPNSIDYIEIDYIEVSLKEIIEYFSLVKRFRKLSVLSDNQLAISPANSGDYCYSLRGHTFDTLNDVEKALNNKAFL